MIFALDQKICSIHPTENIRTASGIMRMTSEETLLFQLNVFSNKDLLYENNFRKHTTTHHFRFSNGSYPYNIFIYFRM